MSITAKHFLKSTMIILILCLIKSMVCSQVDKQEMQNEEKKSPYKNLSPELRSVVLEIEENMIVIPGGAFTMGCTSEQGLDCWDNEKPSHEVTLNSFQISKYEVTQKQWRAIMGVIDPLSFHNNGCGLCPAENISWNDAQSFIEKLNRFTGQSYRLPTEAEWEYAARGGQNYKYAGSNTIDSVAWFSGNYQTQKNGSEFMTKRIGCKIANGYGLYDMNGNVWEYCSNWQEGYTSEAKINPVGSKNGERKVVRGGGWGDADSNCRVTIRAGLKPNDPGFSSGFRLSKSH